MNKFNEFRFLRSRKCETGSDGLNCRLSIKDGTIYHAMHGKDAINPKKKMNNEHGIIIHREATQVYTSVLSKITFNSSPAAA